MLSILNWLFESPHSHLYNYLHAGAPGDLAQLAQIEKQTTLTPECSRYRVAVWLQVHDFDMYHDDLRLFDGRRLLEMSSTEELLWREQLRGNHVNRLFRMINKCREECGVKRKEYHTPPGEMTLTLDDFNAISRRQCDDDAARDEAGNQTSKPSREEDDEWRHWVLVGGFRYSEDLKWRLCKELGDCDDVTTVVRASARWLCVRFLHCMSPTTAANLRNRLSASLCKEVTLTLIFLNAEEGTRLGLSLKSDYTMSAEGLKVGWLITEL